MSGAAGGQESSRRVRGARSWRAAMLSSALVGLLVMVAGCAASAAAGPEARSSSHSASPSAPPGPAISVSPRDTGRINPTTPVRVAAHGGTLQAVRMTNVDSGVVVSGKFGGEHLSWASTEPLGYGSTYRITAAATGGRGQASTRTFTVSTLSPDGTAAAHFSPSPSLGSVGVGQPLIVTFTQPVTDRAAVTKRLHVTSAPAQPGAWYWIDDQHVHYRPKNFWQPGTTIHVDAEIYGIELSGGVYGASDEKATYHVHDSWIAKANGATHEMTIYHSGEPVKTMDISMGKPSTPTHRGIHVISEKDRKVEMDSCSFGVCPPDPKAYDVMEYWAERISNDGEFVHENPASVGAQGNTNVSHGCINLNEADAKWFFTHFGLGDVVIVQNSGGPELPLWDRYGDWSLSWSTWQAGNLAG